MSKFFLGVFVTCCILWVSIMVAIFVASIVFKLIAIGIIAVCLYFIFKLLKY